MRKFGTTLIELLVAVTFLSVAGAILLQSAAAMSGNMDYARRRLAILKLAQTQLDTVRSSARSNALVPGTTTSTSTVQSLSGNVTITQTISLVAGYTLLYNVGVTCSWTENTNNDGTRADTLSLNTSMEAPDS